MQQEPEVAGIVFALGPKLLLNLDDVPATNLLQPGNRATYRLLVADRANDAARSTRIATYLGNELKPGQRIETVRDLRPEVRQTLERAEKFVGLAALVAVLLAAVAVALAASRYLRRHLDAAAMFRCFGARVGQTLVLFFVQFLVLGVVACGVGVLVALAGQQLLVTLMSVGARAPTCRRRRGCPARPSFGTGVLLLFGFALPPLVALAKVPPLRVLRRDLPRPRAGGVLAYGARRRHRRAPDRVPGARGAGRAHHGRRRRRACSWPRRCARGALLVAAEAACRSAASRGASVSPTCADARSRRACRSARWRWASWRCCCSPSCAAT